MLHSMRTLCKSIEKALKFQIAGKSVTFLVTIKLKSFEMGYITCCKCRDGLAYMFNGFTCGDA